MEFRFGLLFVCLVALFLQNVQGNAFDDEYHYLGKTNFTDIVLKDEYCWTVVVVSHKGAGVLSSKEFTNGKMDDLAHHLVGHTAVGIVEVEGLPLELLDSYSIDKTRLRTPMTWVFKRNGKLYKEIPMIMDPAGHLEMNMVARQVKEELDKNEVGEKKHALMKVGTFNWHPEL